VTAAAFYQPHPSCQIPGLAGILERQFGRKRDGSFVEVGAFDGETCSNTSFLADLGWRGLYIEPVPVFAAACRARHQRNARVAVVECAIGSPEEPVTLAVGHVLTTADPTMARAYGEIPWAQHLLTDQKLVVPRRRLDSVAAEAGFSQAPDLLVVDVEGAEEAVFDSFDLARWRPRVLIVELEDAHPSFQDYPEIVARARRLRARILGHGYAAAYQDEINTVFFDASRAAAAPMKDNGGPVASNHPRSGQALEAPRITFPPMEGASFLARRFGLAPRFDVMATLEKGPLCYTTVLGKRIYFVNDAEYVKRILLDNLANYPKSATYRNNLRPFLGDGLLISEGDFWKRQRRLAQPAFHLRRLKVLAAAMGEAAAKMSLGWEHGKVIDVLAEMNAVTMDIVARTLFGADVSGDIGEVAEAMAVLQDETGRISATAFFDLPDWIVKPRSKRFEAAVATLDRIVGRIVAERRASGETRDDLLSMLLEARDEDTGEGMTDKQLRDELVTLFLAGHETTAIALTWTFHLLGQTPRAEAILQAEVDEALGTGPDARLAPTFEDLDKLPYARMVAEEAMRLYPPAYVFSRRALADDQLGPYRMPAGAHIVISPYALHRRPDYWPEADAFWPERFAPGARTDRPKLAYLPFGGGPRICIGNSFAMMEHAIVLAAAVRHWRVESIPGRVVRTEPRITLRPRGGLPMRVMRR
jgi:FkbM family methyltransferase